MSLQCQLCSTNLERLSIPDRQRHYDAHFDEPQDSRQTTPPPSNESSSSSWLNQVKWRVPTAANLEKDQDKFWYATMQTPPPSNFTPGLIPILKKALLKTHTIGTTTRAVLCYERAVYVNRQMWDANWGCGYRNFLMSCAALMDQPYQPMYFPLLDRPIPPGIRNLQKWIEEAWAKGFDEEGHFQLKKLVGTHKWIGTSDLYTAFVSRGIPARLVDFELKDPSKGLAPLTNWIVRYFDKHSKPNATFSTVNGALIGASPVQCASCLPIVVQNDGHSRMVVGYELTKQDKITLLVFDPSKVPSKHLRNAALATFASSNSPDTASRKRQSSNTIDIEDTAQDSAKKRFKVKHTSKNEDDDEVDDEVEFVDEHIPAVRHSKENILKVNEPSFNDVLKHFRWENRSLKRNNKYQILYFPLEEPLTESQMSRRKVLTSEQI